ncbi:MAG: MBL fold metallo-hydrolase [Clostridia bacterium]|jgi:metallo-beta-lactamase family protein|nr:MBL fold metallo-hydrolase [Clostridia bacterium]NLV33016.1 MBL fold metallo-hydrolase [Clostridiaceae bacterium]
MKLTFYGSAKEVTGSNMILEAAEKRIMIDCGMFQGSSATKAKNFDGFKYDVKDIDYVLLTHSHIDHSGRIPLLYKKGYNGSVICTKATKDLCDIMLLDSANIQESDTEYKNHKRQRAGLEPLEPLYTTDDANNALKHFVAVQYHDLIKLDDNITVKFSDSGHMLGSSSITVYVNENDKTTVVAFTSDLGKPNTPIINDPQVIQECDYLIMESTYGNKRHAVKEHPEELMFEIIEDTILKGGTVIIPSFSVGRTQEMIYAFNKNIALKKKFSIFNKIPVYIDSPLSTSATEVFMKNTQFFDDEAKQYILKGDNPLDFPNLIFTKSVEDSKMLNRDDSPKIIISSSGMCDAGRIRHHLKHNLYKEKTTVLFVGYQANGSLGRILADGAKSVKILGDTIDVRARIEMIDGFSGHADMDDLDNYLSQIRSKPEKIFLVHGEDEQLYPFASRISNTFGIDAVIPDNYSVYELQKGKKVYELAHDRVLTQNTYKKLTLLDLITDVKRQVKDISELIAYDEINNLDEEQITTFIDLYSSMRRNIKNLINEVENKTKVGK